MHLAPILLGEGIRLLDQLDTAPIPLASMQVVESAKVTDLRFRIVK